MSANGAVAEGYAYDAYGKVRIYSFRPMDYDKDGDQDASGLGNDFDRLLEDILETDLVPPANPQSDRSREVVIYDGVADWEDYL